MGIFSSDEQGMTNAEAICKDTTLLADIIHGMYTPCAFCKYAKDGTCFNVKTYSLCLSGTKDWLEQEQNSKDIEEIAYAKKWPVEEVILFNQKDDSKRKV